MSRRIEVELTSDRGDGTWTWRAAGAKQPKGVLGEDLLYPGAKVGDVVRAEADFDIEGITVLSVLPPRGARVEPERIEIVGPPRPFEPVISNVTGRDRDGDDRPRRPRREGGGGDRDRGDRRGPRSGPGERRPGAGGRPDRPDRPDRAGARPSSARPPRERPAPPPPKPKAKKLRPGRTHRDALLASLPPEQQSVAEQVIRGGMPAVRAALEEQNSSARAEGRPEVPAETLLAMAEAVLPQARVADWLDRAEAALADADELALRDLRSVVVSADDVARDESTRPLAAQLREVLERRTGAEQEEWLSDLSASLEGGRVVRALRLSSRPPEPTSTLPAELTTRLAEAAGAAMTADIAPDRWATVLDAVAYSPVRRSVTPAGVPAEPGDELLTAVRKHAGRVPAIAALFGVAAPPSPGGARRSRPAGRSGARGPRPAVTAPASAASPAGPPLPPGVRRIPPPPPGMLQGRPIPPPPGPHRAAPVPGTEGAVGPTLPPELSDAPASPSDAPTPVSAGPALPDPAAPEPAVGTPEADDFATPEPAADVPSEPLATPEAAAATPEPAAAPEPERSATTEPAADAPHAERPAAPESAAAQPPTPDAEPPTTSEPPAAPEPQASPEADEEPHAEQQGEAPPAP